MLRDGLPLTTYCRFRYASRHLVRNASHISKSSAKAHHDCQQKQKPLILLLGGALMNLPSLEKYWALHNSIGYDTAAVTTEFSHYTQYSVPGFQANAVECVDALRALCSSGLKGPVPVVVHTISNGGTVVYPFAAKLMEQTGHFEVVGHILDSAPGPWNRLAHIHPVFAHRAAKLAPDVSFLLLANGFGAPFLLGRGFAETARFVSAQRRVLYKNWSKYPEFRDWVPHAALLTESRKHPLLFLYSSADWFIPHGFVEAVMERLTLDKGREVLGHNFGQSKHCLHLKEHPREYKGKVVEFMNLMVQHSRMKA